MPVSAPAARALLLFALALSGCGASGTGGSRSPSPSSPPSGAVSAPATTAPTATAASTGSGEVLGSGTVLQVDGRPATLCFAVARSYPPQCRGITLAGEVGWVGLGAHRADDVRWVDSVFVVGRYDRARASLALTRPVTTTPPPGWRPPLRMPRGFPTLCTDPFRGGDPTLTGEKARRGLDAATARVESLESLVGSYVTDGSSVLNVVVATDAPGAFRAVRTAWQGGLCVVQRDLPTARAQQAAVAAIRAGAPSALGLAAVTARGVDGSVEVTVAVADDATVTTLRDLAAPSIDPDRYLEVTGLLTPLPRRS